MRIAAGLAALLLPACTAPPPCPTGTAPAAVAEMAFGRNIGATPRVTDADWAAFLAEEATPRFPEGLTALDAAGQWRAPDGRTVRESAKLLLLVMPGLPLGDAAARAEPLAAAYRVRFGQDGVLATVRHACLLSSAMPAPPLP